MNIYIYENSRVLNLEPITLTRPSFDIRCGALTCIERISFLLPDANIHLFVRPELEEVSKETFPGHHVNPTHVDEGIWLLGNAIWSAEDIDTIKNQQSTLFYANNTLIGANLTQETGQKWLKSGGPIVEDIVSDETKSELRTQVVEYLWEAIDLTHQQIEKDVQFFTEFSSPETDAIMINEKNIFAHKSTIISKGAVIDASNGPVIIANETSIKPLAYLEGPLYLGEKCIVEPMTQIKGGCSIGSVCKLGGEINSVIIQGWSNKVHDGHLGDAYLGQWVNLGAGTVNSNLKNNYSDIDVMVNGTVTNTGSKHVGCFMGDHVKTAIGTRLNTGTVIGPGSNIAVKGFPPKTIQPYSWCVGDKIKRNKWDAFIETAKIVEKRRGLDLSPAEEELLFNIFEI
ncbi:MAG: putative sugar nucleotidyl transferase [Candidatus Marinimicrobia bacterium]|nr:putative sugar nucleotidyl transferase [Candidatus Neomarinimicrobiota bacterium]